MREEVEYNLALGERRAIAVRHYLIELGVNPSQIQTKSYGEENPAIGDRHDEEAWNEIDVLNLLYTKL